MEHCIIGLLLQILENFAHQVGLSRLMHIGIQLSNYLDQTIDTLASGFIGQTVGGKLKDPGITIWINPNTGNTNSSGFSALAIGERTNK